MRQASKGLELPKKNRTYVNHKGREREIVNFEEFGGLQSLPVSRPTAPEPDSPKTESDEVVKQEKTVEEFIEEHRPILEDPDAGHGALSRTYVHGAGLITSLGKKSEEAARRATKATNDLTAAMNDPNCSAAKVDKREKEYKRLLSEHERLLATFNLLSDFAALVKQRLDNEFDEDGERRSELEAQVAQGTGVVPGWRPELRRETSDAILQRVIQERESKKKSWWQRLFSQRSET